MKYLFLDVETTGISPYEHSVTQIAAILEVDGCIQDKIILDVAPIPGSKVDPEALAITGKTLEEIEKYPSAKEQLEVFTTFLQKHIGQYDKKDKLLFLAYNAPFDFEFMRNFFTRQGNKFFGSYFWNPAIDVMTLAMERLKEKRPEMTNFKLSTVSSTMGIEIDKNQLHDAYYDILITYQLYKKLSHPIASPIKDSSEEIDQNKTGPEAFKDSLF